VSLLDRPWALVSELRIEMHLSTHHAFFEQSNSSSSATNTTSARAAFDQQQNEVATVLEYLMTFASNLSVGGIDSITLQSSTLAELTKPTSALTRDATVSFIPLLN
jgi:hypothetical protein